MTAFDEAWELAKLGEPGLPIDQTSEYYDNIVQLLGLGDPINTGEQRRVFDIPEQSDFVAKVVNKHPQEKGYPEPHEIHETWEDFVYPRLSGVIPKTAERLLVPAESMGRELGVGGVVRQPRVDMSWMSGPWDEFMAENAKIDDLTRGLFGGEKRNFRVNILPTDPRFARYRELKERLHEPGDRWYDDFVDSSRKELMDNFGYSIIHPRHPLEGTMTQELMGQIKRFAGEQDTGPGNFGIDDSGQHKLLDYYWPYERKGIFR